MLFYFTKLLDMTSSELTFLSNHMGHDVGTHTNNYRLHDSTIEITKVGRLLMTIDEGNHCGRKERQEIDAEESNEELHEVTLAQPTTSHEVTSTSIIQKRRGIGE